MTNDYALIKKKKCFELSLLGGEPCATASCLLSALQCFSIEIIRLE